MVVIPPARTKSTITSRRGCLAGGHLSHPGTGLGSVGGGKIFCRVSGSSVNLKSRIEK